MNNKLLTIIQHANFKSKCAQLSEILMIRICDYSSELSSFALKAQHPLPSWVIIIFRFVTKECLFLFKFFDLVKLYSYGQFSLR
jgi:hypothetical protein